MQGLICGTFEIEVSSKGTSASRNRASEICVRLPSPFASLRRSCGRDVRFTNSGGSRRVGGFIVGGEAHLWLIVELVIKVPDVPRL